MTNSVSRAKDEKLRIELLQTIFKFKKLTMQVTNLLVTTVVGLIQVV